MAEVKLTKNQLREEQSKLSRLEKYLPTLQLKKAMLQAEVHLVKEELRGLKSILDASLAFAYENSALLVEPSGIDFKQTVKVQRVDKHYENIAGVEVPYLDGIAFEEVTYSLFDTPPWLESMVETTKKAARAQVEVNIAKEKKRALEKELREVSIRVNLFEKILIPRAKKNIRKIKVFLDDQQLAAVSQAKVAKKKIEDHKKLIAHAR